MGVVEELIRAREAYDRREWLAAYGGLSDAAADVLTPDDFNQLATAAYLLGRRNDCVQALQRAYQLNLTPVTRLPRSAARSGWPWCCSPAARRRSAEAGWPARNGCSPRSTATLSSADMCSFT
jgi:hypothetical protein